GGERVAVDAECEGRKGKVGGGASGVEVGEEENGLVVNKTGVGGEKAWRGDAGRQRRGREVCHLRAPAAHKIEDDDLDGLFTLRSRPEVRKGDPTAVWAERDRSGKHNREAMHCVDA